VVICAVVKEESFYGASQIDRRSRCQKTATAAYRHFSLYSTPVRTRDDDDDDSLSTKPQARAHSRSFYVSVQAPRVRNVMIGSMFGFLRSANFRQAARRLFQKLGSPMVTNDAAGAAPGPHQLIYLFPLHQCSGRETGLHQRTTRGENPKQRTKNER
jgi:hypothetical protein